MPGSAGASTTFYCITREGCGNREPTFRGSSLLQSREKHQMESFTVSDQHRKVPISSSQSPIRLDYAVHTGLGLVSRSNRARTVRPVLMLLLALALLAAVLGIVFGEVLF